MRSVLQTQGDSRWRSRPVGWLVPGRLMDVMLPAGGVRDKHSICRYIIVHKPPLTTENPAGSTRRIREKKAPHNQSEPGSRSGGDDPSERAGLRQDADGSPRSLNGG